MKILKNDFLVFEQRLSDVLQKEADNCKELVRKFVEESQPIKDNLIKIFPIPLEMELFVFLVFSGSVVPSNAQTSFTGQDAFEEKIETFKDDILRKLVEIAHQKSHQNALLYSLFMNYEINVSSAKWISKNGFSIGPMYNTADDLKRNGFHPIVFRSPTPSWKIYPPFILSSDTTMEDILESDNTELINAISDFILRQP